MTPPMRMYNACGACRRQYDVTSFEPGSRLKCSCGATFHVEFKKAHAPRALKCSNCGGVLEDAARKCGYCAAEITLEERRLDSICPDCSARMASDAKYCMECGVRIDPQALAALKEDAACPRCKGALRSRAVGQTAVVECSACGGLWLGHGTFEGLCQHTDEGKLVARSMPAAEIMRHAASEEVRYLPCPQCAALMNRKNFGTSSGVILDLCREHGVWLDHSELEKVMRFIESGGLDDARRREVERLEARKRRAEIETIGSRSLRDDDMFWREQGDSTSRAVRFIGDLISGFFD